MATVNVTDQRASRGILSIRVTGDSEADVTREVKRWIRSARREYTYVNFERPFPFDNGWMAFGVVA